MGELECTVTAIADCPTSITGARSFWVSKGMFGIRLGFTPCVSNTTTKV